MGFRDLHPDWPYFDFKTMYYICWCQIDDRPPFALSGHQYVTHAHYSNGNLARHWMALQKNSRAAMETGPPPTFSGIWTLLIGKHRAKLTVEYISPSALHPLAIDPTSIRHEPGESEQSQALLDIILSKLDTEDSPNFNSSSSRATFVDTLSRHLRNLFRFS